LALLVFLDWFLEASFFGETLNAALPFFVLELSFFTSFALPWPFVEVAL
jgi:integral membrane sensor domain MASE1